MRAILLSLALLGCGGSVRAKTPAGESVELAGAWSGTFELADGTGSVVYELHADRTFVFYLFLPSSCSFRTGRWTYEDGRLLLSNVKRSVAADFPEKNVMRVRNDAGTDLLKRVPLPDVSACKARE